MPVSPRVTERPADLPTAVRTVVWPQPTGAMSYAGIAACPLPVQGFLREVAPGLVRVRLVDTPELVRPGPGMVCPVGTFRWAWFRRVDGQPEGPGESGTDFASGARAGSVCALVFVPSAGLPLWVLLWLPQLGEYHA